PRAAASAAVYTLDAGTGGAGGDYNSHRCVVGALLEPARASPPRSGVWMYIRDPIRAFSARGENRSRAPGAHDNRS
ncbi:hypothetical protein O988_07236, partial [Pseudogymnoascus sp. VKM F-3808]